jgi:molybdopterin synthase catalytic subunit
MSAVTPSAARTSSVSAAPMQASDGITVKVQTADFDIGTEIAALRKDNPAVGAVASFMGCVRDMNDGVDVALMYLEHYPGMTERELHRISSEAKSRWNIFDTLIIHRVGELKPLDQIVLVAVTSAHRGDALAACEFIMDYLKTQAPFWKREATSGGERWVDARTSDDAAAARWKK